MYLEIFSQTEMIRCTCKWRRYIFARLLTLSKLSMIEAPEALHEGAKPQLKTPMSCITKNW